jgi:hypothetical protein
MSPSMLAAPAWHWGAFAFAIAALFWALYVTRARTALARMLWLLCAAAVGVGFFGGAITSLGYVACGVLAGIVGACSLFNRRFDAARWHARFEDPIVLRSPFRDAWRVAAGGADPRHNHHQAVSDQYFAYDFLREDGASWDCEILAPVDGTIAWTEDRHEDAAPAERHRDAKNPAGNYVSIETPEGYVILAHLKKGSITVLPGVPVRAGELIGLCGNSGNTTQSHLHVHAQNRAQIAVDVAEAIPIAFADPAGKAWILDYGDVLLPTSS